MWLIPLVPLVIAWTMAFTGYGIPDETSNKGELVTPGLVVPQQVIDAQNSEWGLVIISDKCDATCEQQLYRLQQLYLSMGKQAERLQTVWVSNDVKRSAEQMSVEIALKEDDKDSEQTHRAMDLTGELSFKKMIQINDPDTFAWFEKQAINWQDQSIFFVDPLGNIVLRFNPELSGRDMMSDIKWLFKASRVG